MPHSGPAPCLRQRIGGDNVVPYHQVTHGVTRMDAFTASLRIGETPPGRCSRGMEVPTRSLLLTTIWLVQYPRGMRSDDGWQSAEARPAKGATMDRQASQARAERFRQLHRDGMLVLLNAWDAGSARILEAAGCPAIATTSAGISWSYGLPDGQQLTRAQVVEVVERITRSVSIPVSADIEGGYGETPEAVAATVRAVVEAGAVGINLEDVPGAAGEPLVDVPRQCARIEAARRAADELGVSIVINARTDVYLLAVGDPATRFEHTVQRLNAYREAGADCLFVPGVRDATTIGELVQAAHGPLNTVGGPGAPPLAELRRLGVARVSLASRLAQAAFGLVQRGAREILEHGAWQTLEGSPTAAEMNALMAGRDRFWDTRAKAQ